MLRLAIAYLTFFHLGLQTEMSGFMNSVTDRLDSLTREVQDLKKEHEKLRQLL